MQKLRHNWKKIVIGLVVLLVLGFVYQKFQTGSVKKPVTYTIKRQDLKEELSLSGHVDATEHAVLLFQTAGQISWVGVKVGDYVKPYQTLASLDQQTLKKQLQKDLNTYIKSRNTFDQNQDNNKNLVISDSLKRIADNYQQDLNNTVLDVELQSLSNKYAILWTPIEGIVSRVDTPVAGVNITTPTQAVFEVVNPKTIYFSSVADQTDVVKLKEGMAGKLTLDSYPDKTVTATITSIGFVPKVGESGTVYEVRANIGDDNDSEDYRFGMTGDMTFILKEKAAVLALPKNLVKDNNGQKFVYLYSQNKTIKRNVTVGETLDNQTEIIAGLSENDVVANQP